MCRESLCWTRGWGARVRERNYVELWQKSLWKSLCPDFLHRNVSSAIKIQISQTSPAERILIKHGCITIILGLLSAPAKNWQWHHIYTQMALPFYWLHCSSWIWKGNLPRPCGCSLEPVLIWGLCCREMYKNEEKWKNRATSRQPSSIPTLAICPTILIWHGC